MRIEQLRWPPGWRRTPAHRRESADRFNRADGPITFHDAEWQLRDELSKLGATNYSITTDRYSDDPSVAVYFVIGPERLVLAQDRFETSAANLRSVGLVVEAMRTIARHGRAMVDRAFAGFTALPPPPSCWEILGVEPGADRAEIDRAYRAKALRSHPDRGGSTAAMAELNAARDAALASL